MIDTVKFIFYLKSGKTFECFEELSDEQFKKIVETIKISMRESVSAVLCFGDCVVRTSDCSVVEWEVLDE